MIKEIFIFDIDGVLLDSTHRYRIKDNGKIDLDHWRENCTPEMIWQDEPLHHAEFYKKCLQDPEKYVIIATARVMSQADWDCIEHKIGLPDHFIHRKIDDNQSGVTLKGKRLKKLLTLKQFSGKMVTMLEDNLAYLKGVGEIIHIDNPVYVPSNQGH